MTYTQPVPGKISDPLLPGGPWELNCPFLPVTFAPPARSPEEQVVTWSPGFLVLPLEPWASDSTSV